MEYIVSSQRAPNFWDHFGQQLATLHQHSNDNFGLDHDNYIGSLPQRNRQHKKGIDFFITERLQPQLELAMDNHVVDERIKDAFENLYKRLPEILPDEKPALLHGDLWSGNFLINEKGDPSLIDPAVYYGSREAELAFTRLFGGFDESFYASYHRSFPLVSGFEERVDIYNLYPLLVHANLFGASYVYQIRHVLQKFG